MCGFWPQNTPWGCCNSRLPAEKERVLFVMPQLSHLDLTAREKRILVELSQSTRYPVARFELHSDQEPELVSVALNYVRITEETDSMELVRERSDALRHLMELGLVFLDYTVSVWAAGDYDVYYRSKLYEMFCHTVMEGAKREGFLFDLAVLRKGRAYLTNRGVEALKLC